MPRRTPLVATTAAALGVAVAIAASSAAPAATNFQMPFRCHVTVYGQSRADHSPPPAIDFNGLGGGNTDLGMPVVAAASGTVTISTYYTTNGYGNAIEIGHGANKQTFYAHLRDRKVKVGQHVKQGQLIGHVGHSSAKYTFTAHLHYEQRYNHHAVKAVFNGHLAPTYSHMEQSVKMRSLNCPGSSSPSPSPTPAPSPSPAPAPSGKGVALPSSIKTRRAATVRTDNGLPVASRMRPNTSAAKVKEFVNGNAVRIVCQKRGQRVTGKYGTSRLWDLVVVAKGRGAYITDTYVYTGSDGRVAPNCP